MEKYIEPFNDVKLPRHSLWPPMSEEELKIEREELPVFGLSFAVVGIIGTLIIMGLRV